MSQGTPNKQAEADFDADAWIAERDLDKRQLRFGGKVFEFNVLKSSEEMKQAKLLLDGDADTEPAPLIDVLAFFLADPKDSDELRKRFRMPAGRVQEYAIAIYSGLFGDVDLGESSASSPESELPGGTPSASTSESDSEPASA